MIPDSAIIAICLLLLSGGFMGAGFMVVAAVGYIFWLILTGND